jgi:catechol-2,3-dioxygenase
MDGYRLIGSADDHGVSEALCLDDRDGSGIKLYWNEPGA